MTVLVATEPIVRAKLREAAHKRYTSGVLGLIAQPVWEGGTLTQDGRTVTVAACPSHLAIWEALERRADDEWLVILTPVDEEDLGSGILAHLIDGRLLTPDPWAALCSNFSALTIEPALYRTPDYRTVASRLLDVLPAEAYAPAPGGVLTRDHVMTTIASAVLGVVSDPSTQIDGLAVLEWSRQKSAPDRFAEFAAAGTEALTSPFVDWLSAATGRLRRPVAALLRSGRLADLVPLGIVARVLADDAGPQTAQDRGLFLGTFDLLGLGRSDLVAWSEDCEGLVTVTLAPDQQHAVLDAAAARVRELRLDAAAATSDLLPQGLHARLDALAAVLRSAGPSPSAADIAPVEAARDKLDAHFLAAEHPAVAAFEGAVRLVRWLAGAAEQPTELVPALERYLRVDGWVDAALVAARRGADSDGWASALRGVIDAAAARRRRDDRVFAAALAATASPSVPLVENVIRDQVIPLAKQRPTLLLVVDALSIAATTELVMAAERTGWSEGSFADGSRGGALAVLPTLTGRSRCSLLCGELREGPGTVERAGFLALLDAAGLAAAPGRPAPIFHKAALSNTVAGASLATDVTNAVNDTAGRPLVAVVLNYVDDTLHHTDPGGTDWTLDRITYLRPLLLLAQRAGRAVVITSDHGHIIEHGDSTMITRTPKYGQRAHGDTSAVGEGEVLVRGHRVLTADHTAVLAVDDTIRYGARNAGYHGGASPAEAVVPVVALYTGDIPAALAPIGRVNPPWWDAALPVAVPAAVRAPARKQAPVQDSPGLFDAPVPAATPGPSLGAAVVASAVFAGQLRVAGRVIVSAQKISALIDALVAAPANELTTAAASAVIDVAATRVKGALTQIKSVLDVEGYDVLPMGDGVVRLDIAALREQFGVSP